jgi:hypothetical protein
VSIIQDALRRKEPAPTPPPPVSAPPQQPTAFPPPPLPPEHAKRPTSPILVATMIAVLVAGAAFFAYRSGILQKAFGRKPSGTSQARPEPPAVSKPVGKAAVPPSVDSTNAAAGIAGTAKPGPDTGPGIAPTPATTSPTNTPPPESWVGLASNVAPQVAKPAAIRWPNFVVRGVIAGKAGTGSVILDKALIDVGQSTASGLRVVGLAPDGVVLEFQGQQRTFSVGSGVP